MEELLGMTVGRVFLMFDDMMALVRLTNPWGNGDEESTTIEPCRKCGELEDHALDCTERNRPQRPRRTVEPGVNQNKSGFDMAAKAAQSGLPVNPGIDVATIDTVRARDSFLADLLEEAQQTLPED